MSDVVKVNGKFVERVSYKGMPVVMLSQVDELHKRPKDTSRKTLNRNRDKFIEGEDYFKLEGEELAVFKENFGESREFKEQENGKKTGFEGDSGGILEGQRPLNGRCRARTCTLLTESGYLMIVKTFNDALSWKIQRDLVNVYFKAKESPLPSKFGLSMSAVPALCRQADAGSRYAKRALTYFYGMPVQDIDTLPGDPDVSEKAGVIVQFFQIILEQESCPDGVKRGAIDGGYFIEGLCASLFALYLIYKRKYRLGALSENVRSFGGLLGQEAVGIELLGWRLAKKSKQNGYPFYRFEKVCSES